MRPILPPNGSAPLQCVFQRIGKETTLILQRKRRCG